MNIYILFFFCIFSSLSVSKAFADTISDEQTWLSFSSLGSLNKQSKLLYWFDLGVRYGDTFSDVQTTLLRPGVGVKASDTLTLLAGYARFSAHRSGPNKNEHRLWQDTSKLLGSFAGGFVKGRSRFEVKYRDSGGTDTGYRLRGRIAWEKPAKNPKLSYLVSNEIFYHLNTTEWGQLSGLDQNRIFLGLNAKLNKETSFSLGYIYDYLYRDDAPNQELHIFSTAISLKI